MEIIVKDKSNLDKSNAMKCFAEFVKYVTLDPDPKAQLELAEEKNCENCDSYKFCSKLSKNLLHTS